MINGINHITISVKNIDTAFSFYKDILKLKPIMKSDRSAYFMAGKSWIALDQRGNYIPSENYSHICFNISKRKFNKTIEYLHEKNVKEWQENQTEGNSIYIFDDSGNKLELHYSNLKNRIKEGKKNWGKEIKWFV